MQQLLARRSPTLLAILITLVASLTLMSANTAAAAASARLAGASADAVRTAVLLADPPCPPNSSEALPLSARRCVAETVRSTRSGLNGACLVSPKALAPNPWYYKQECRGGWGAQVEAIAQSRAIAWLNAHNAYGDTQVGGISANIQWEPLFNVGTAADPKHKRADILVYNRSNATAPIQLIEVKGTWIGGTAAAATQLSGYLAKYPQGPNNRPVVPFNFNNYADAFRVLYSDCKTGARNQVVNQYKVRSTSNAGVLEITGPKKTVTPCNQGEPKELPIDEQIPEDIPEDTWDPLNVPPPVSAPKPGRDSDDDDHDDFIEWILEEHPELVDMPAWPDLPEVPVPDDAEVLVDYATIIAVVAVLGLAAYATAPLWMPILMSILGSIALAEGGSASLAAIATGLAAFAGLLAGGRLWGDPHLATVDGLKYDLQAVGEFHLLEIPSMNVDVQSRFVELNNKVSETSRIVTEIDDSQIEFRADGSVYRDGVQLNIPSGGMWPLGDGGVILRHQANYVMFWPGYEQRLAMMVSGRNVGFVVPPGVTTRGLLGNSNGDPLDDLALRDGTPLAYNTPAQTLQTTFADSWRVTDEDTMFTYGANESTADFTNRNFPQGTYNVMTDFSQPARDAANQACTAAGVTPGPQFESCVLDILVTNDPNYAVAAAPVDEVLVDASTRMFDASGALSENFEGTVPSNFAALS